MTVIVVACLFSLLMVSGCTTDSNPITNNEPTTPSNQQKPALDAYLERIAVNKENPTTFTGTYAATVLKTGETRNAYVYQKGKTARMDMGEIIRYYLPDKSIQCPTDSTKACRTLPKTQLSVIRLPPKKDFENKSFPVEIKYAPAPIELAIPSECFEITRLKPSAEDANICLTEEGILTYAKMDVGGNQPEIKLTEFRRSVDETKLVPPSVP